MTEKRKEVDLYRDTPVRYLGYANEVGEAFRSIVPNSVVWSSYLLASGYVLADTLDKACKTYNADAGPQRNKNVLLSTADTLLWQSFASVIVPGFTINRICAGVQSLQRRTCNAVLKSCWLPTLVGLASIPLIIRPIDQGVEHVMNVTYRKWVGYSPESKGDDPNGAS